MRKLQKKKNKYWMDWGVQTKISDIIVEPLNKLSKEFSLTHHNLVSIPSQCGFEILNLPWTMENQYSSIGISILE